MTRRILTFVAPLLACALIQVGTLAAASANSTSQTQLTARLLSQADLPAGWDVYSQNGTAANDDLLTGGCLANATSWVTHHPGTPSADEEGSTTEGRNLFEEALSTGKNAQHHVQLLVRALDNCHGSSTEWHGFHITVSATVIQIPGLGVGSHSFAVDFREGLGASATDDRWDVSLFRVGAVYGSFQYHANEMRTSAFRILALAAVGKVALNS